MRAATASPHATPTVIHAPRWRATIAATISVTPTLADAAVRLVDDASLIDGTAAFDYVAPTVEERTAEVLSVTASLNGVTSNPATFSLAVAPPPDPAKTLVTVSGPSSG